MANEIRMAFGLAAAALLLVSCATSTPKTVSLPDGQQGLAVSCSGTHHSWSDCMNAAGAACGGGYDIISQNGETVGGAAVPVGNSAVFAHAIHREMIVSCKGKQ
jgi:hypothetical protein